MANGNVVQMGPAADNADLEHELIHIEQHDREPLIFPVLYTIQSMRKGYRKNKYEDEAYSRSGSRYLG